MNISKTASCFFCSTLLMMLFIPVNISLGNMPPFHPITQNKQSPEAVTFRGVEYLSVKNLADILQGQAGFANLSAPLGLQHVCMQTSNEIWTFPNGGDRVSRKMKRKSNATLEEKTTILTHPLLVLKGAHYLSAHDITILLGCKHITKNNVLEITHSGKTFQYTVTNAGSLYLAHRVSDYTAIQDIVKLTQPIKVWQSLLPASSMEELAEGTVLVLRRQCVVDGQKYIIGNATDRHLNSYLIPQDMLEKSIQKTTVQGTDYADYQKWFETMAIQARSLQSGSEKIEQQSVCLTIDFCWSVRRYEESLIAGLLQRAASSKIPIHPLYFISGRWMEQHPEEMHNLVAMSIDSNIEPVWGGHSWAHPKTGNFLNDFEAHELKADTLKMESLLLEWGIVPSVFYRFPGLIHNPEKLRIIQELGLFSIDCSSWLAQIELKEKTPFAQPVQNGSVILVHGNGNEPIGIPPLVRWMNSHPKGQLEHIISFFPEVPENTK